MTDHRPTGHNDSSCCLWSVMYLCSCWIVVACDRSCICVLVESLLPLIGHIFVCLLNRCGSTSTQIHDRSQATTIPLADKYMIDHRPQRFNKHTNTWPIRDRCSLWSVMYLCACWIVVACYRSCICLLMESLWPVIGHVFVCLLNRCCLWSVMYLCASWIVVACDRSCPLAEKYMTVHRPQRFH
jgi:hypothetical protein